MANRLTDTKIWNKAWFRKAPPKLKEAWRYLCDSCDHAGVWDVDFEAMAFNVGEPVSWDEISAAFGGRVRMIGCDKIFVTGFVEYQYKTKIDALNPCNKVHLSVIRRLEKLGLYKGLSSPLEGDKDKNKEKDQAKEKEGKPLSDKEIYLSLPIMARDRIQQKYDAAFIEEGVAEAVTYHSADASSPAWPPIKWGKIITSWLAEKKRRLDEAEKKKGVDTFSGVAK